MSVRSSRSSGLGLGDLFSFASYVQVSSNRSLDECLDALRSNQRSSTWFGGYNLRFVIPKTRKTPTEIPFGVEYYRQRYSSSRSSHKVQQMKGLLYCENNQTHLLAKVKFTGAALIWLWLALVLTLVSVGLLVYTRNVVTWVLIGMTGMFLLALILVMWLDRYWITRWVRRSLAE